MVHMLPCIMYTFDKLLSTTLCYIEVFYQTGFERGVMLNRFNNIFCNRIVGGFFRVCMKNMEGMLVNWYPIEELK